MEGCVCGLLKNDENNPPLFSLCFLLLLAMFSEGWCVVWVLHFHTAKEGEGVNACKGGSGNREDVESFDSLSWSILSEASSSRSDDDISIVIARGSGNVISSRVRVVKERVGNGERKVGVKKLKGEKGGKMKKEVMVVESPKRRGGNCKKVDLPPLIDLGMSGYGVI
ncbi:hypothetical protein VNO78_34375 [Psophocarpus tetragonolobus]|uniref:Transmembrane protein n=1 Tax=Psophocarpus tetragonolobus TaxID=3891 RepID=A0AAN9RNU1_PSOTE